MENDNAETKGQLEFLLNLLCQNDEQDNQHTSDNEQDNDDVRCSTRDLFFVEYCASIDVSRKIKILWKLI
jgi:hypothetical protein